MKPALRSVYGDLFCGTADLYVFFHLRAVQLLRAGGMLVFISSNKWFRAAYGATLRRHISDSCHVDSITDFGELPVFETASTFPMIFIARKYSVNPPTDSDSAKKDNFGTIYTQVTSLEEPYPDVLAIQHEHGRRLPDDALRGEEWRFADKITAHKLSIMESAGIPLGEYVKGQIYYGIKTGFNEAFVIDGAKRDELIREDSKSAEIIKPLAVGDDVRKWHIREKDKYLIFTRRGVEIDRYPAIKKHLEQWREELTPKQTGKQQKGRKPGPYHWYEIQDNIAYYEAFEKPKIVTPDICKTQRFVYDNKGTYIEATATIIAFDDIYLLAVLNSKISWEYLQNISAVLGDTNKGGRSRLKLFYLRKLPVPLASTKEHNAISALAQNCLDAKGVGCEAWEAEIDERVERLYGLE